MQTATENERKYDVPDGFTLPALAGAGGVAAAGGAAVHELDAVYFDTADLRLARNRRTLRRRTGGTDAGWHLKTPGDGAGRTEHRLPPAGDNVPEELRALVRAVVRTRPLEPVARLHTRRVETPLTAADGRTLALLAEDEVRAETGGPPQHWRELEVELVDGGPELLDAVERLLRAAGARPAAGPSKLSRALGDRLAAARPPAPADPVVRYAREQRDAIVAHDPGVRAGDPEAVHRMRVATRRLRSTLKTYRRWFPDRAARRARAELRWLAGELGAVRDGQVLERALVGAAEREGPGFADVAARIRARLGGAVAGGHARLVAELDGERYLRLLDDLDALVDRAPRGLPDPRRRARRALRAADDLLEQARTDGADEHFHEARKAYKRARYAVEALVPVAGRPARSLAGRLTDLQDVLGAHQDSVVARELLHELAGEAHAAGENAFGYGLLYARQQRVAEDTLGNLPLAVRATRRRRVRRWLDRSA